MSQYLELGSQSIEGKESGRNHDGVVFFFFNLPSRQAQQEARGERRGIATDRAEGGRGEEYAFVLRVQFPILLLAACCCLLLSYFSLYGFYLSLFSASFSAGQAFLLDS